MNIPPACSSRPLFIGQIGIRNVGFLWRVENQRIQR